MRVIASHNKDKHIRLSSSAGGVFSILADKILQLGGIVYGASFDCQWGVRHIRVVDSKDLERLRGSKYVFSDFISSVSEAIADLALGKIVLFSGTPCQIAALKKKAGENDNLYLVEVVCHGAPDKKYWKAYLDELCAELHKNKSDIVSINFRDKCTGWKNYSFTIKFDDGEQFSQPHDDNIYMRAFLSDYTLREACFHCPFKYPDGSKADLTIGDFWGISQLAPELDNNWGTTIVIVRTQKGETLCENIEKRKIFTLDQISEYNPAIIKAPQRSELRDRFLETLKSNDCAIIPLFKKYLSLPLYKRIFLNLSKIKCRLLSR